MIKITFFTGFALAAFAFNSILCRMALKGGEADAAGFTVVRLVAGAVALIVIGHFTGAKTKAARSGNWISGFFLFAYAICFSFAYLGLNAATGALILFGCVQLTIILIASFRGERPSRFEWAGLVVALGGLVYLVLPGLSAPPLLSAGLMAAAGAAWGIYTLRGKSAGDPIAETTGNFVWSLLPAIAAGVYFWPQLHLSSLGIILAVLSGAVASGIGYALWYAALKHLSSTRAAVLQLSVPVITAAGGVIFLAEAASKRLWIAAALIVGGIALTIFGRRRA